MTLKTAENLRSRAIFLSSLFSVSLGFTRIFILHGFYQKAEVARIISGSILCFFRAVDARVTRNKLFNEIINSAVLISQLFCELESITTRKQTNALDFSGGLFLGLILSWSSLFNLNWKTALLINLLSLLCFCLRTCESTDEIVNLSIQCCLFFSFFNISNIFAHSQRQKELEKLGTDETERMFYQTLIKNQIPNPIFISRASKEGNLDVMMVNSAGKELFGIEGEKDLSDRIKKLILKRENTKTTRSPRTHKLSFEEICRESHTWGDANSFVSHFKTKIITAKRQEPINNIEIRSGKESESLLKYGRNYPDILLGPVSFDKESVLNQNSLDENFSRKNVFNLQEPNCTSFNNPSGGEEKRYFLVKCCQVSWENQSATCFIFNEFTESFLKARRKAGDKNSKEKADLLAAVSHKLYTPLNIIISSMDNVKITLAKKEKELRKQIKICLRSAHLLFYSIRNLVDISKKSKHTSFDTDLKNHQVGPIIEEVLDLVSFLAKIKNLQLEGNYQQYKDHIVCCDAESLKRVLLSLIDNSLKYTPPGGKIKLQLNLRKVANASYLQEERTPPNDKTKERHSSPFLQFVVQDDGCGISEARQQEIACMFAGVLASDSTICTGLSLSQLLLRNMMSKEHYKFSQLRIVSLPKVQGTIFSFMLPIILNFPSDESRKNALTNIRIPRSNVCKPSILGDFQTSATSVPQPFPERVLIVDDDFSNQLVMKTYLKKFGLNLFETANNGQEAIEKVLKAASEGQPYKIILMDLNMPVKNGYEASREITSFQSQGLLPENIIIAVTANVAENDWPACRAVGMKAFLTKPVNKKLLRETLEGIIGRSLLS